MKNIIYLNGTFSYREDTLENWEAFDPVLKKGEPAIVRDGENGRWLKIGDGVTSFKSLPWKQGPEGEKGYTPIKGVDYFTAEEKDELAEQVARLLAEKYDLTKKQ